MIGVVSWWWKATTRRNNRTKFKITVWKKYYHRGTGSKADDGRGMNSYWREGGRDSWPIIVATMVSMAGIVKKIVKVDKNPLTFGRHCDSQEGRSKRKVKRKWVGVEVREG